MGARTCACEAGPAPAASAPEPNRQELVAAVSAAIAEELGMELKIEDMAFDSIITAVSGGKADMGLAGMTVNPDREKNVNFQILMQPRLR